MKNVKDLKEKEVVLCITQEECEGISELLDKAGLRWKNNESYLESKPCSMATLGTFCFYPKENEWYWLDYYIRKNYTIHEAKDFLPQQDKVKTSLEDYLRDRVNEVESMLDYSLATDTLRAWIDTYNEALTDPTKQVLQEIIKEWHESKMEKSLIN